MSRKRTSLVEETGGGGADGGIDLLLAGSEGKVLVQCKQWRARKVGVDRVQRDPSGMNHHHFFAVVAIQSAV